MDLYSWNRFYIRNFSVATEVMGQAVAFPFKEATITIKLPHGTHGPTGGPTKPVAETGMFNRDTNAVLAYRVLAVDVEVDMGSAIELDAGVLDIPANSILIEKDTKELKTNLNNHHGIAEEAFEYWLSVLRWTKDDYTIGRYEVVGNASSMTTSFRERRSDKTVFKADITFFIAPLKVFTLEDWKIVQHRTANLETIPAFVFLLHDAEDHVSRGDFRRAMIDLAISCEIFLRQQVLRTLPTSLEASVRTTIEEANISQYSNKFFLNILEQGAVPRYKSLKEELNSLFSKRNAIVHMGVNSEATEKNCVRFVAVAKQLFMFERALRT